VWSFPLKRKTAKGVAPILYALFRKEGTFKILQADNGKEFKNKLVKNTIPRAKEL